MCSNNESKLQAVPWVDGEISAGKDDALFAALARARKRKRRRLISTIFIMVILLGTILAVVVGAMQRRVREQFMPQGDEILSAQAERGSISTVVSGSGVILNVDTETLSVPDGVEVTEILVAYNDTVAEGELLALVDMATVRSAMSQLQAEIDELDSRITAAEGDTVSSYISAGVPGRVKCIHAEPGDLVEDVMVDHGALAVLSLDGYMALEIETDALAEGDAVTVILSDGTEETGSVKSVVGHTATILLTDDGPAYGEEVYVQTEDGTPLGSAALYIHNPLKITGYAGTVNRVSVSLNQTVYAATTAFTLTDTASHASYDALLRSRSEKEETLLELLTIQRCGGITAPIAGSIYSVADLDTQEETELADIITISPDVSMSVTIGVDEGDILSLELGQTANVTVSSVSEDTFLGVVTEIDKTDADGAYTAVVTLDKAEGMLPGMSASVDVRIEGADNVILIPYEALHRSGTGYYVYTSYDEETQEFGGRVDVVPGLSNSQYAEIRSGLSQGDTVYYTEEEELFPGMGFGGMGFGAGGGQMPGGTAPSGGQRPDFGGGNMPSGAQMPGPRG